VSASIADRVLTSFYVLRACHGRCFANMPTLSPLPLFLKTESSEVPVVSPRLLCSKLSRLSMPTRGLTRHHYRDRAVPDPIRARRISRSRSEPLASTSRCSVSNPNTTPSSLHLRAPMSLPSAWTARSSATPGTRAVSRTTWPFALW